MDETPKKRRSRKRLWIEAAVGTAVLVVVLGLVVYLRSPAFSNVIRGKVIAALEDATGGQVEMTSFRWNLSQLAFESKDLTIHGLEPAGELPLVHVDRVLVRVHIISFFERQFDVEELEIDKPAVHIVVRKDGTTNIPQPKLKSATRPVQQLFDLAVGYADVRDGMLQVNEHKVPLDFVANDILLNTAYDARTPSYSGELKLGKIDLKYRDYRDVPAAADIRFSLKQNALQLESAKLTSQQSTLQASGQLTNFDDPQLQLTYSGSLNLAQLGAVSRTPQLRGGTLAIDGNGKYSTADGVTSSGRMAFRDVDYQDGSMVLRGANLNSNFVLAKDRVQLSRIAARLFGGEVTGDADIKNLSAMASPAASLSAKDSSRSTRARVPAVPAQQEGSARLRLNNLAVRDLARVISSRSLPLDKLNPAGTVSGTVNLAWKDGLENTIADLALDIAAPREPATGQLPIAGTIRGRYTARWARTELANLNLSTPRAHIEASGVLAATTASLKVSVKTSTLADIQPLLAETGTWWIPFQLEGEASFDGTVNGRLTSPEVDGHLQASNFTYVYVPEPPTAPRKESKKPIVVAPVKAAAETLGSTGRKIHIDQFAGDLRYSPSGVALQNATITEGKAQLNLSGATALDKGVITDTAQFHLQARLQDGDVTQLQRVLGTAYPVAGEVNFKLQASGEVNNPQGSGHFSLSHAELHGRPISSFSTKIEFANRDVKLEDIHLKAEHGTMQGSAEYQLDTKRGNIDLTGKSIDLADIPEIQTQRLQSSGIADFTVKGSGSVDNPAVNAHLEIASLTLNGDKVGNLTADAVTRGTQLTVTARSRFPKATFLIDGTVDLQGEMPGTVKLQFSHLDFNPFLPERVRAEVTRQALLDGTAELSGPFKQPRLLQGRLDVRQFSVEVEHIAVQSDGAVELRYANETISVQRCTLTSEDTHFTVSGTAALGGDRRLDLRANGLLNLKLAQTVDPDVTSYGIGNVDVHVRGTAEEPSISGEVEIAHAGVSLIDAPLSLGDLNGTLTFNQDRLDLTNLSGRVGGGYVKLGGFVTYGRTIGFDVTAQGRDIRFRYSGFSVTSDQLLHLTGTLQNALVAGNITITRFAQLPSSDFQAMFAQVSTPARIPNPRSPLNNIHLEVRIQSTPELTLQTSLAKLSGDVDLRLRGTAAHPVLLGRVNIAQGDIKVAGTKYHLERGDINFLDPVRIDPVLDVDATTRVRDYDITIGLHGTIERLNTTYRSDPPLSTDDIISLLAFGKTQTETALGGGATSPGFAESASGAILSSALNQAVSSRVSRIFGSSLIRINPSIGGIENDPNARLTLEQQVSNDITLTYITNLARSAQEVIQFEYNINSDYTLQGIRDENGVVSFDLLIRKRKR